MQVYICFAIHRYLFAMQKFRMILHRCYNVIEKWEKWEDMETCLKKMRRKRECGK